MTLNDKLKAFGRSIAESVECQVYHYWRSEKTFPCVIWAEDSEAGDFNANNKKVEQIVHCTVDYFTHEEYDDAVDSIQVALDCYSWRLNSVQYEEENNLIHYEWEVNVG